MNRRKMMVPLLLSLLMPGCGEAEGPDGGSDMAAGLTISEELFGTMEDGRPVNLYTLRNSGGMEVQITGYGGIVTSISVPDRDGEFSGVVLGFDNLEDYLSDHPYFGGIIGRYANRIAGAEFELDGERYPLAANDGENHLHGGIRGFDRVVWSTEPGPDATLTLSYLSEDGEEGYPGNLEVRVVYSLTEENELVIDYEAVTDRPTHINLTNHSYFNLTGEISRDVLGHTLQIQADRYTPVGETLIPTGELAPVDGTPFDFREPFRIGERIDQVSGGYDHNYVLSDEPEDSIRLVSVLHEPDSGRKLEVLTTEPGIQFYSGNFLDGSLRGTGGIPIEQYGGLCLETQHFPDTPNQSHFPSTVLREGEVYRTTTVYRFSTE